MGAEGSDGNIAAGGPSAYNVHGTNGYDAGNVLNLEFMTWMREAFGVVAGGLAWNPGNGKWYSVNPVSDRLVELEYDVGTASTLVTEIGPLGNTPSGDPINIVALTFNTQDGHTLYGVHYNENAANPDETQQLYSIDTGTGAGTLVGNITNLPAPVSDMDFFISVDIPPTPSLWLLVNNPVVDEEVTAELWKVSTVPSGDSLHATFSTQMGYPGPGVQGLCYDSVHNVLFTRDLGTRWMSAVLMDEFGVPEPGPDNLIPVLWLSFDITALVFVPGDGVFNADKLIMLDTADTWFRLPFDSQRPVSQGGLGFADDFKWVMRHDYNLDGLLDQGEVREAGTENYTVDAWDSTINDGRPDSDYPFNRRRLTEDVVAALDASVDWDELVMSVDFGGTVLNFLHSVILLPPGIIPDGLAPGGRPIFVLPAPGMDLPIKVQEDGLGNPLSPIWFSDWILPLGGSGETGLPVYGYGIQTTSHEWLHVWESYPDLYDYDEYGGGFINYPVGLWDPMSGPMVHPAPPLKQAGVGVELFGTEHSPWLEVTDLRDVLNPLEETQVVLPDYAFFPGGSAYAF